MTAARLGSALKLHREPAAYGEERARGEEAVAVAGLESIQVDIPAVELFRSRLGRRTVAEVMAYSWSADPTPYLDAWFLFGRAEQSLGEV